MVADTYIRQPFQTAMWNRAIVVFTLGVGASAGVLFYYLAVSATRNHSSSTTINNGNHVMVQITYSNT